MKIKVSQLRRIIREEVERNLTESKFKVGDKVEEKGTDSGWWEILELIPDNRTGKTSAKLKMFTPSGGRTTTTYVNTDKLTKVRESLSRPGSLGFGDSPDPQDVYDEFLKLRDPYGEVPIQKLADQLGVGVNRIDFNGTGLRVLNTVVTEIIGDTPYRKKMGEVKNLTGSNLEPVLKLGNIYRNKAGHQISIEFLNGKYAGWELLARGKPKSLHGTSEELQAALTDGGFRFDRIENVY
jgi:hypothetical protein